MQRVTVICVGKLKERFYIDAAAEYAKRLSRYCRLELLELPEQRLPEDPSPAEVARALSREAEAIRGRLPAGAALAALCVEGKLHSSEELAGLLETWGNRGGEMPCVCHRQLLRSGRGAEAGGPGESEHVAHDFPASSGPGDAAGAALSGLSDQ